MNQNTEYSLQLKALYEKKQKELLSLFSSCSPNQIYEKIIEIGKNLPQSDKEIEFEKNLVSGCQSTAYIDTEINKEGQISYELRSDALISKGLGALLLFVYNKQPVELILFHPPLFIQELGLNKNLSPGRSNGLASLYSRMKKDALILYLEQKQEINFN